MKSNLSSAALGLIVLRCLVAGASFTAPGCGAKTQKVGGETNWLSACTSDEHCVNSQCLCGVCSRHCTDEDDCSEVRGSECVAEGSERTSCPVDGFVSACLRVDSSSDVGTTSEAQPAPEAGVGGAANNMNEVAPPQPQSASDAGSMPAIDLSLTEGDAEVGAPSPNLFELPEGGQGFDGEITFDYDCEERADAFPQSAQLQVFLEPRGSTSVGRGWMLPADSAMAELSFDVEQRVLSGTNLAMSGGLALPEFRFEDLQTADGEASGVLARTTVKQLLGDIAESCEATGTIRLVPDTSKPSISRDLGMLVGFAPLTLAFTEPVRADFSLEVEGETIEFTRQEQRVGQDFVTKVSMTPTTPLPPSGFTLRLGPLVDNGSLSRSLTIKATSSGERDYAMNNLSFEQPWSASGPWFGSCEVLPSGSYFDGQGQEREVMPTDGAALGSCSGAGLVLQAYVEPPSGANAVLFDVGEFGVFDSDPTRVTVTLRYPDGDLMMTPQRDAGSGSEPILETRRADLDSDEPFWLLVHYTGVSGDEGDPTPQGQVFVDHLRFE